MIKAVVIAVLGTFGLIEALETFVYKYIILDKVIDVVKGLFGKAKVEEQKVVTDVKKAL